MNQQQLKIIVDAIKSIGPSYSVRTLKIMSVCWLFIFAMWIGGIVYFYNLVKQDNYKIEQIQEEQLRKEDNARRMAAYKRHVQQQTQPVHQTQNAVDFVNK